MPELVSIKSEHYELVVWTKDIEDSAARLEKTLAERGKIPPESKILVSPELKDTSSGLLKSEFETQKRKPIFFENKLYEFEVIFSPALKSGFASSAPRIEHRLRLIEEAFHYNPRTNSLRATINTGNDVGWLKLDLVYKINKKTMRQSFSFEVFPLKMDMVSDISDMSAAIDEVFPLWRFTLAEKTQHRIQAIKRPHKDFLLLWLSQYNKLFENLHKGLKEVVNAPHSRLVKYQKTVKMDELKGKLSPKLEEGVARALENNNAEKRFTFDKRKLSVDTPENRFVKSVILTTLTKLTRIRALMGRNQVEPEKQRLSDSFFGCIENWQNDMRYFRYRPLFQEVGKYTGLTQESLVLQQKPGYSRVYRVWQQLKWYLELLDGENNLSLRSVAELYEVWCFLEVRRILLELDFLETSSERIPMVDIGLEVQFKDGMKGTFNFKREDGVTIRLAHEPRFSRSNTFIKSWTTTQKPDIYLEASFPNGEKIVWLFDAKYRIKKQDNVKDSIDYCPDDAINQMHRYRDALIHIERKNEVSKEKKSRPVFGGYALYPGYFNQQVVINPYDKEIEEVGIGAFSLLPSEDNSGCVWLTKFLSKKLKRIDYPKDTGAVDKYYVEEAPRIPYLGTRVSRVDDLVIVANQLGPKRVKEYVKGFELGNAKHYHTKDLAFERESIESHIVNEIRYLAVACSSDSTNRKIEFIYPVIKTSYVRRSVITPEQSGTKNISSSSEMYWLFQLGSAMRLKNPLSLKNVRKFKIKLSSLKVLANVAAWDEIPEKYSALMK